MLKKFLLFLVLLVAASAGAHPAEDRGGESGVVPLLGGLDALTARVALTRAAEVARPS